MAKSGTKRKPSVAPLTEPAKRLVAEILVRDLPTKTLKQIAYELKFPYNQVWKVLREYVNVSKGYSLRFDTKAQEKPEDGQVQG